MKGITLESTPYICEEERGAPTSEQTVFWIKPKTHHEANKTLSRYAAAGRDGRQGYKELHTGKLDSADVAEWLNTVSKIENFAFPESFYLENDKVKPDKRGYVKEITEEWLLKEVINYLPAHIVNEIWDVAIDNSKLREGEKKS